MTKKILIILLIAIVAVAAVVFIAQKSQKEDITKQQLLQKFQTLKTQYEQAKEQGYDVKEAEEFGRKAKQSFDSKDYKKANEFLDKAFEALKKTKIPATLIPATPMPLPTIITPVKVWLYEWPVYETHPYYYDGTFKGLIQKIPSIADLGVKTIYLMPIWEQPQGKENNFVFIYQIRDYYKINPVYGTSEDLRELVNTVHKYDMKIVFDLVTCCAHEGSTVWNNNWILNVSISKLQVSGLKLEYATKNGIKYVYSGCDPSKKQASCEVSGRLADEKVLLSHYPHSYWGYAVDRTNPEVIQYFTDVAAYYVKEYDIDGWRVDAPVNNYNPDIIQEDHSNVKLLRTVKKAITNIKPDAVLISENPSAIIPKKDLPDPVFDEMSEATYSYYFIMQLNNLKTSEKLKKFFVDETIFYNRTRIRHLETHDSLRINQTSPQLNKPLIVLISTIPGIPMIQTGQEIGATNSFWPTNPSVDWKDGDYELREFYKKVFKIRGENDALKYGTIENVWKSGDNVYAYSRTYENETVVVVINFNSKEAISVLGVPFEREAQLKDELSGETFTVTDAENFKISVPAYRSRILTIKR